MGIRIKDMTPQPEIKDGDFFVIDGADGTRKVPVQNLLVLAEDTPTSDVGVDGEMYAKIVSGKISDLYVKLPTYGWQSTPVGGSYVKEFQVTEGTYSHNTITVVEE